MVALADDISTSTEPGLGQTNQPASPSTNTTTVVEARRTNSLQVDSILENKKNFQSLQADQKEKALKIFHALNANTDRSTPNRSPVANAELLDKALGLLTKSGENLFGVPLAGKTLLDSLAEIASFEGAHPVLERMQTTAPQLINRALNDVVKLAAQGQAPSQAESSGIDSSPADRFSMPAGGAPMMPGPAGSSMPSGLAPAGGAPAGGNLLTVGVMSLIKEFTSGKIGQAMLLNMLLKQTRLALEGQHLQFHIDAANQDRNIEIAQADYAANRRASLSQRTGGAANYFMELQLWFDLMELGYQLAGIAAVLGGQPGGFDPGKKPAPGQESAKSGILNTYQTDADGNINYRLDENGNEIGDVVRTFDYFADDGEIQQQGTKYIEKMRRLDGDFLRRHIYNDGGYDEVTVLTGLLGNFDSVPEGITSFLNELKQVTGAGINYDALETILQKEGPPTSEEVEKIIERRQKSNN